AMSQRERDRLRVLQEVKQKHLTQVEAAQRLKVTDRHVRRMLIRMGERGDGGIVHQLRGRPSNRKLAASWEQKILARIRHRYADFGPTLAAEHLAKDGLLVSRETLQDRLVKEMRLAGIDTIEAANQFLELRFIPEWEQRFTVAPRQPRNAHRRLGPEHRLEEILSMRAARKVAQDHTVSWEGNRWGVLREEVRAGLRGAHVEVERRLDGSHWLRFRGRYLGLRHGPEPSPRTEYPNPKRGFLPITHGGHFNMAENRTFLLCVDTWHHLRATSFRPC